MVGERVRVTARRGELYGGTRAVPGGEREEGRHARVRGLAVFGRSEAGLGEAVAVAVLGQPNLAVERRTKAPTSAGSSVPPLCLSAKHGGSILEKKRVHHAQLWHRLLEPRSSLSALSLYLSLSPSKFGWAQLNVPAAAIGGSRTIRSTSLRSLVATDLRVDGANLNLRLSSRGGLATDSALELERTTVSTHANCVR